MIRSQNVTLRVIRNLYWEQEATIRIDYDYSVHKPICKEVRQGCVFFSRPLQYLQRNDSQNIKHHEGVREGGNNINNLSYTDDTVLINKSISANN